MPRPCNGCDIPSCAICVLYHRSKKYRDFWDSQEATAPHGEPLPATENWLATAAPPDTEADYLACHYRGEKLLRIDCGCTADQWTYRCAHAAIGGECMLRKTERQPGKEKIERPYCNACDHRTETLPAIETRNLLYHVCPITSNEEWRRNVRSLVKYSQVFNGRRVIAIATGENLHDPSVVRGEFGSGPWEWVELPNDKELREYVTFLPLLESIASSNQNEATFYAHTKGVDTERNLEGAKRWRVVMYEELLGKWEACTKELESHHFVGVNKIVWPAHRHSPFPTHETLDPLIGDFMLAGTFYWFRHDLTFSHPRWRDIPRDRYGVEAWPSIVCSSHRSAKSMFQPWPELQYPNPTPYNPSLYEGHPAISDDPPPSVQSCPYRGHLIPRRQLQHIHICLHPDVRSPCAMLATPGQSDIVIRECLSCQLWKNKPTRPIEPLDTERWEPGGKSNPPELHPAIEKQGDDSQPVPTLPPLASPITKRNLLVHLTAFSGNGQWQRNLRQIRARLPLFNGRRILAIATAPEFDSPTAVRNYLGSEFEYVEIPNNPNLREVATFLPLFESVVSDDPHEATLYMQAKGVTRPPTATSHLWGDILYETCMDYWPFVARLLEQYPLAGPFKKVGHGWGSTDTKSNWHYSGSWFWFRNGDLFSKPDWRRIDQFWSGIEPYPSLHFRPEEAASLFHPGVVPTMELYSWEYMITQVLPDLARWRVLHEADRKDWR